jgi:hypothetical protein
MLGKENPRSPAPRNVSIGTVRAQLSQVASRFMGRVTEEMEDVREGVVMSPGVKPYRRLDCDGRALAYVRTRPRRSAVRVDVSGLWVVRRDHPLRHATASGSATLYLHDDSDIDGAVAFLRDAVTRTREAYERENAARMRRSAR